MTNAVCVSDWMSVVFVKALSGMPSRTNKQTSLVYSKSKRDNLPFLTTALCTTPIARRRWNTFQCHLLGPILGLPLDATTSGSSVIYKVKKKCVKLLNDVRVCVHVRVWIRSVGVRMRVCVCTPTPTHTVHQHTHAFVHTCLHLTW